MSLHSGLRTDHRELAVLQHTVDATHRRLLVRANLSEWTVKVRMYRALSVPVLFFASIPIAVWSPVAAQVGWIVIWLGYVVSLQLPWSWLNPD